MRVIVVNNLQMRYHVQKDKKVGIKLPHGTNLNQPASFKNLVAP